MLNGRRRQRADIGQKMRSYSASDATRDNDEEGSCYPRISSRTGGYESSVASYLVSSTSEHASWSTGEDDRTIKADNTTSHELLKFVRLPATIESSKTKPGATKPCQHQRDGVISLPAKDKSSHKPKETNKGLGRTFLRKLVNQNGKGIRVARNNTDATVEDIVSDDSRNSPHRRRFVLPDDIVHCDRQANNGYEVLTHPNKTMTIVHSSLAQHLGAAPDGGNLRRKQKRIDLVDTDDFDNVSNSDSSTFSQLLMTDGDLMKNRQRFGSGAIRLTMESLKKHEEHLQLDRKGATQSKKQPLKARRKHPFAFWRRTKCETMDRTTKQFMTDALDSNETSRIERKRQEYLQEQRQREFGSVTKEQRKSIFDSLVDNKSRATLSTVSSTSSHMTPRCHGCPTTGAMVDTVSFWSE